MSAQVHAAQPRRRNADTRALLIIDMISHFEFEGGAELAPRALECAKVIANAARRTRERGEPVIYANDNFGRWRSSVPDLVDYCRDHSAEGAAILDLIEPADDDYFVLKPRHSAFFGTPLEILLHRLEIGHLVLCGVTTEYCVHFTAVEAYFRDYELTVLSDGCAAIDDKAHDRSLEFMREVLGAALTKGSDLEAN